MLLSIITVNYNDVLGLERTLRSVQSQTTKAFEHIIIDGGSTDGSKDLIASHEEHFQYWVSEPDAGIYDAMNKGIAQAKGEYVLFLNSGDVLYRDDVLSKVHPALSLDKDIVYGNLWIEDTKGVGFTNIYPATVDFSFLKRTSLGHGATFIKRVLFARYGNYRTDLKIVSDWAFFIKTLCVEKVSQFKIDTTIATFYKGGVSTTSENINFHQKERKKVLIENFEIYDNYYDLVLVEHIDNQMLVSKINPNIKTLLTNRFLLVFLNKVITLLVFILKQKRRFFYKR